MKVIINLPDRAITKDIPTRWEEVTFNQFIKLAGCASNYVKIVSVFTGLDEDIISRTPFANMETFDKMLGFINTKIPSAFPKSIIGYTLPDLNDEFKNVFHIIRDDIKLAREPIKRLERYTIYCAIYACKEKYGKYDWKKAEEMKDEFLEAPAPEVLAVGNFTLAKIFGNEVKQINFNIKYN
jgi:hypothetical protein